MPNRISSVALLLFAACAGAPSFTVEQVAFQGEAKQFLDAYQAEFQKLYTASSEAEWASNTKIVENDDTNAKRTQAANEALAAFTGSTENIRAARRFLDDKEDLTDLQVLELERVLFMAAAGPQTVPELVRDLIKKNTEQSEKLYGFNYEVEGKQLSVNDIDEALRKETNLGRRRLVWQASKMVGPELRPGLVELRRLRNETVRALGYDDYSAYKISEYGMTVEEMKRSMEELNRDLRPLYRELHTWARHELAARYGQPVPDLIPAHWLPNRWGQDWNALLDVPGFDLDDSLKQKSAEWLVQQAERFYVSLGFDPLPASFYAKSSLYPLPADASYKKNNHASAWHIDLQSDVRSLMSVEPNTEWYETTHHELGHIYYYMCYSNPDVPLLLRNGANRAYHEAIGSLMGLAAMQPRFVDAIGLDAGSGKADPMQLLLKEALNYVVFIPWSTGTMFHWEHELYADELPQEKWNERWWELAAQYQGIEPPGPRGEEWCDAATKTHVNDDPAEYYDYALSYVLLFQFHDHIARKILREDPHDTNYFGQRDVGEFLESIMTPGASVDWRAVLKRKTEAELSAKAMVEYFEPLRKWLAEKNRGRTATLPTL